MEVVAATRLSTNGSSGPRKQTEQKRRRRAVRVRGRGAAGPGRGVRIWWSRCAARRARHRRLCRRCRTAARAGASAAPPPSAPTAAPPGPPASTWRRAPHAAATKPSCTAALPPIPRPPAALARTIATDIQKSVVWMFLLARHDNGCIQSFATLWDLGLCVSNMQLVERPVRGGYAAKRPVLRVGAMLARRNKNNYLKRCQRKR